MITSLNCSMCGKRFSNPEMAIKCAFNHKKLKDKYYEAKQREESFRILQESAHHPAQLTLLGYC